jgi:hypothetical protein
LYAVVFLHLVIILLLVIFLLLLFFLLRPLALFLSVQLRLIPLCFPHLLGVLLLCLFGHGVIRSLMTVSSGNDALEVRAAKPGYMILALRTRKAGKRLDGKVNRGKTYRLDEARLWAHQGMS